MDFIFPRIRNYGTAVKPLAFLHAPKEYPRRVVDPPEFFAPPPKRPCGKAPWFLIKNPINRYLINSPMLPNMKKNADGSLTLSSSRIRPGRTRKAIGFLRPTT